MYSKRHKRKFIERPGEERDRFIIPRGGGRPVTSVNLGEAMPLSDTTTPLKRPRF